MEEKENIEYQPGILIVGLGICGLATVVAVGTMPPKERKYNQFFLYGGVGMIGLGYLIYQIQKKAHEKKYKTIE